MAIINYAAREMTAKIVYYGPGLSGKTTSIQYIHSKINPDNKGKLVSLATETDRTLFFDFFPVDFGKIGGFRVKFNFYTVPGQVFYNTTRKLVLKGADGVVFVADSQNGMQEQNKESLENLHENLRLHGFDPETMPFVIQYNKRDMPNLMELDDMRSELNLRGVPEFETSATVGTGVMEAMRTICKMVLEDLKAKQQKGSGAISRPAAAKQPAAKVGSAAAAQAAKPAGVSEELRTLDITVDKPKKGGNDSRSVVVPLNVEVGEGVDAANVKVEVKVTYKEGEAKVTLGQIVQDIPKKGFLARLFGG
ncbi:MAG: hypothetical protein C0608_02615 [Deltaproteobacteria bacterium]|nr:MAG: hypothetical protein C0608_02615 [Deltaproteobacteria bacterium]